MDEGFFTWLSAQYCESCLLLNILASERLLDRLRGLPFYTIPNAGEGDKTEVKILDLADCALNDEDAQVLAALLVKADHVKAVDFSQNEIGDAGAVALSEILVPNAFVSHLNLAQNNVGEIGGLAFCNALSCTKGDFPGGRAPIVTLNENPLPLDLRDLLSSFTPRDSKTEEDKDDLTVSTLAAPDQVEANDFSSEEDEVVDQMDGISAADQMEEGREVLERYVRKDVVHPGVVEIDSEEVLELPEYPLDLEELARKDFLEEGIRELLSDSDVLNLSNLGFPLSELEGKLQTLQTCHITELDLSDNGLESIPKHLPESLRRLYLRENEVKSIENLFNCPGLRILDLGGNHLGSTGQAFLTGLCVPALMDLRLAGNSLCDLDVLNSLGHLQNLDRLDLGKNNLEPVEVINQLGEMHASSLRHLILEGNAGAYDYSEIARKKLKNLERLDLHAMGKLSPSPREEESKLSNLFLWRTRRRQKEKDHSGSASAVKVEPEPSAEDLALSPSGESQGTAEQTYDFGDFLLLAARLGVLELPHERSSFTYFSRTSEFLSDTFRDLDCVGSGLISGKGYARGFDTIQKHFAEHICKDRRPVDAIIDSRMRIRDYLGNPSLRALFGSFSKAEGSGRPETNALMTFLDLLRWIDTCLMGKTAKTTKKKATQQKLIVSFFTRERKVPKFNFLDFIFSIFFVCNMTKLSADKVVKHVVKRLKTTKPITLASADEIMSLDALKADHITQIASPGVPQENETATARKIYHEVYQKGFPVEEFVKHKDTDLLLGVIELAVEDQEKFASADFGRILQLRKSLGDVTRKFQNLMV